MQSLLEQMVIEAREHTHQGKVATYIPELAKSRSDLVGAAVCSPTGETFAAGDCHTLFTMQSISKIVTLMLALLDQGEDRVFAHVGKEPTGDPFNSIIKLETYSERKPLNPMINAGAIAVTSLIAGNSLAERECRLRTFFAKVLGKPSVSINENVFESERESGHRNRSLAYFMKDIGVIKGDVTETLDLYFRQCSVEVNCVDLARLGALLANDGVSAIGQERVIPVRVARIVKTLMVTCGLYDESGEFAVSVGIPAKSGVGGGIVATVPNRFGVGVFGPALDRKGNSVAGVRMLEWLSSQLDWSIF